ncbi:SURF1 family protein [Wenzhouxiangella sp. XN24]|uniref:SURF1 family protein n=1 Tax=Wenzhouxiangella sp. XN24 TaxID=2713569 RepID=UPI0013EB5CF1|nr:SURF1 family protein [Wenzhouxiangella sp. XN24]NGX17474.1 SURF1 family protein [Wenzhouxiangella sp. XN24]
MRAAARALSSGPARRFRPGIPATLFTAFFLPLLLFLGSWQLDRAGQKQALFDAFAAGGPAVALDAESAGLEELRRYAPVEATGRYLAERQFLLDNMVAGGQAGYRVWTPLLVGEDRVVLVDRGWVPRDFSAEQAPDVAVDPGPRTVAGLLDRLPRPGIELDTRMAPGWPKVVQFPTLDELSEALGRTVMPGVLLLDAAEPDGYLRDWRASDFGPERHLGYAFQWFALAVTLVILYLAWSFRKSD